MPRNSRKQIVGKTENYEFDLRIEELTALERSLHRAWRWCGNTIMPMWEGVSRRVNRFSDSANSKEAD